MSRWLGTAGATQVSFGEAVFSHEDTAAGLSLSCSLAADASGSARRGVKAACLCTAMVERLGAGAAPVPEEKLKKVWDILLEVLGDEDVQNKGEDLFQEEYVAARGQPMLLLEGPSPGKDSCEGIAAGRPREDAPRTPRLTVAAQVCHRCRRGCVRRSAVRRTYPI